MAGCRSRAHCAAALGTPRTNWQASFQVYCEVSVQVYLALVLCKSTQPLSLLNPNPLPGSAIHEHQFLSLFLGLRMRMVTAVTEHSGALYLGSLHADFVGVYVGN